MSKAKYYQYETGQSFLSIPKAIADSLGWKNQEKMKVEIKTLDGITGLFLSKA
jgi:hypothetical protein